MKNKTRRGKTPPPPGSPGETSADDKTKKTKDARASVLCRERFMKSRFYEKTLVFRSRTRLIASSPSPPRARLRERRLFVVRVHVAVLPHPRAVDSRALLRAARRSRSSGGATSFRPSARHRPSATSVSFTETTEGKDSPVAPSDPGPFAPTAAGASSAAAACSPTPRVTSHSASASASQGLAGAARARSTREGVGRPPARWPRRAAASAA